MCIEDCLAAIQLAGADDVALLGFSMGGAVAIAAADDPRVSTVLGLAPWIPERLDLGSLAGRRVSIIHGGLDRTVPGIPGVRPSVSLRGYERMRALGIDATRTVIPWALHGLAVRSRSGTPVPLPRAGRWVELVADELNRFRLR